MQADKKQNKAPKYLGLGTAILNARILSGKKQKEFEAIDIDQSILSQYERGMYMPGEEVLAKIEVFVKAPSGSLMAIRALYIQAQEQASLRHDVPRKNMFVLKGEEQTTLIEKTHCPCCSHRLRPASREQVIAHFTKDLPALGVSPELLRQIKQLEKVDRAGIDRAGVGGQPTQKKQHKPTNTIEDKQPNKEQGVEDGDNNAVVTINAADVAANNYNEMDLDPDTQIEDKSRTRYVKRSLAIPGEKVHTHCRALKQRNTCRTELVDGGAEGSGFCTACWTPTIVEDYRYYHELRADGRTRSEAAELAGILDVVG